MSEYGLIGKKTIAQLFQDHSRKTGRLYVWVNALDEEDLDYFLRQKDFKGINVTIPYKKTVISYLDFIDENAKAIGAVNTIVNRDGKLYGYNTDYDGFDYMIQHHHVPIQIKSIGFRKRRRCGSY